MDAYKVTMSLVVEADSATDAMTLASALIPARTPASTRVEHLRVTVEGSPLNGKRPVRKAAKPRRAYDDVGYGR